ncbi:MAG: hypothetical protein J5636_10990 [Clostridiales bacterium]|nr:hypothetical protein [Clostridiales bacterium]
MKRVIACILSLSMVFALAGCTKEETTKKKTKKTTTEEEETPDTEHPDTSDTEVTDTSETTEASSTSESDTSETSETGTVVPGSFVINHTLENLGFYNIPTDLAFARPYTDGENTTMMAVAEYCDDYYFDTPGYDALSTSLDDFYGYLLESNDSIYETARSKFIQDIADGQYHMSICHICRTTVFRADSTVCSLLVTMLSSENDGTAPFYINFNSMNGEQIKFDDVVTDRAAFCDFVDSYLVASPELLQGDKDSISSTLDIIRNGFEVYFSFGYDGIFVYIESDKYFKVPVYMLADCVNMEYFGNTPESYTLVADDTRVIDWDVDGDSTLDKIKLDITYDEYDAVNTMTLWYNNESASVPSQLISDIPLYYDTFYFMHVNGADYVYIAYYEESAGAAGYCFEIDGSSISFVCSFDGTFHGFPYNPESFDFGFSSEIMGTGTIIGNYTIDQDGHPVPDNTFFSKLFYGASRSAVTKVDIEGALKLDYDLNVTDTITLSAGTTLYTYAIDFDTMYIIYSTVEEDPDEEYFVAVPFELPVDSYEVLINGMPQQELFAGLQFAG